MRVSVIGGSSVSERVYKLARRVGRRLGEGGHTVVCGGLTGVMEAVCLGAIETEGRTIGILPGEDRVSANDYVEIAIPTGLGNARNVLVVLNGDGVIAIDGANGTLSDLGHALDLGRPVAGLETFEIDGVEAVESPKEAITYLDSAVT